MWEVRSGKEIRTFRGHSGGVASVVIDSKTKHVFTGSEDHTIKMFDAETGDHQQSFDHSSSVRCISVNRDGTFLAAGGFEMESMYGELAVWDIRISKKLYSFSGGIYALQFSPDGKYLAYSNWGGDEWSGIWLLDATTGKKIRQLDANTSGTTLSFSSDAKFLAVGNANGGISLFDVFSGRLLSKIETKSGHISSVAFSSDDKKLVSVHPMFIQIGGGYATETGNPEGALHVYDVQSGEEVLSQRWKEDVRVARFTNDGMKLLVLGEGMDWLHMAHRVKSPFSAERRMPRPEYPRRPAYLTYFSDKNWNRELLWEALTGEAHRGPYAIGAVDSLRVTDQNVGMPLFSTASSWNTKYALNSDGSFLVISDEQGVALRSLMSGQVIRTFHDPQQYDPTISVDISPDSKYVVTGSGTLLGQGYPDNAVRIWDAATGRLLRIVDHPVSDINGIQVKGNLSKINAVRFSPDGKYVASGSGDSWLEMGIEYDDFARLWDVATGKELAVYGFHDHTSMSKHSATCIGHAGEVTAIAFSPSGKLIATGGNDNKIFVWETLTGRHIGSFSGHTQSVRHVLFSSDETQIVSRSSDGVAKLWDLKNGQEIATVVIRGDNDFALVLPDGYYASTREGVKSVHFVKGLKVFTLENFDLVWNRPDIVLKRFANEDEALIGGYRQAFLKRLERLKIQEKDLSSSEHLPEVMFAGNIPSETSSKDVEIEVHAKDPSLTLDRINLYANDVPVYGSGGFSIREKGLKEITSRIPLQLTDGLNKIQISAINSSGVESMKETIFVTCQTQTPRTLYVVAIGVSTYQDQAMNLQYAAKDAVDIATQWAHSTGSRFQNTRTIVCTNADATRENILKIKAELNHALPDDQVLLFVAGHGLLDERLEWYFATQDIDFSHPSLRGVSYGEIENLLDGIAPRRKLLLVDACHSGEVDQNGVSAGTQSTATTFEKNVKSRAFKSSQRAKISPGGSFQLMQDLFANFQHGCGAYVISSASGSEFAFESSDWKNGIFTYSLLEGLRTGKADSNNNGDIVVSEIRDYVIDMTRKLTQGRQNPTVRRDFVEYDFPIWP